MLLLWVKIVGPRPAADSGDKVLARYGIKLLGYFGVTSVFFLLAAICALLIIRQTRRAFREEMRENFDELIDGTLQDHARKE